MVAAKRVLMVILALSTLAHFSGSWSLRPYRIPTRAIPVRKASRAEWVMPGESFCARPAG